MGRLILLALLVAIGVWVYFFLEAAGVFLDIKPKGLACKQVTSGGIVGVEDLTIDPETKLAYLSGYDRRAALASGSTTGAIWVHDLSAPDAAPIDVTAGMIASGFWPHGISLYRGVDGRRTLFVINHANRVHSIEVFDVEGTKLTHRGTVSGPELVSPNDIVGVGQDAFYVTNDHANPPGSWMRTAEDYVSADGRSLYLSAASERTVYVYDRDPATSALTQRAAVAVPGFADNIEVLGDGSLLLGVHSKIFDLLGHVRDAKTLAPSHILHLRADGKGGFAPQTDLLQSRRRDFGWQRGGERRQASPNRRDPSRPRFSIACGMGRPAEAGTLASFKRR